MRTTLKEQGRRTRDIVGVIPAGATTGPGYSTSRVGLGDYRVTLPPTSPGILSATVTPQTAALGYAAVCTLDPANALSLVVKVFVTTTGAAAEANCNFIISVVD